MKKSTTVFITETDHERLGHLINMVRNQHDSANAGYVKSLEEGIEFAEVVAPEDIPPDVVTMRSRLKLRDLDSGEVSVYSIVFPTEANIDDPGSASNGFAWAQTRRRCGVPGTFASEETGSRRDPVPTRVVGRLQLVKAILAVRRQPSS